MHNWLQQQSIILQSFSPKVLCLRLIKWVLAIATAAGMLKSGAAIFADFRNVTQDRLTLIDLAVKHSVFLSVAVATLFVVLIETRARLKEDEEYEDVNLMAGPYGLDLVVAMKDGLLEANRDTQDIMIYGHEAGWVDRSLNLALAKASLNARKINIQVLPTPWYAYQKADGSTTSRINRKKRFSLRRKLRKGAKLTNDKKLRLCSDLTIDLSTSVIVQETDYLSSLMTDQLAFRRVFKRTDNQDVLHSGTDDFIKIANSVPTLIPLSQASGISNQLGASTLAFTKDGLITIVGQTKQNAQSVNRLAPSGSGSLDWEDVEHCEKDDFLHLIKLGAARELVEECGLDGLISIEQFARRYIAIYGFSRMIHRAGKPEFFCVAALPFHSAEINDF